MTSTTLWRSCSSRERDRPRTALLDLQANSRIATRGAAIPPFDGFKKTCDRCERQPLHAKGVPPACKVQVRGPVNDRQPLASGRHGPERFKACSPGRTTQPCITSPRQYKKGTAQIRPGIDRKDRTGSLGGQGDISREGRRASDSQVVSSSRLNHGCRRTHRVADQHALGSAAVLLCPAPHHCKISQTGRLGTGISDQTRQRFTQMPPCQEPRMACRSRSL